MVSAAGVPGSANSIRRCRPEPPRSTAIEVQVLAVRTGVVVLLSLSTLFQTLQHQIGLASFALGCDGCRFSASDNRPHFYRFQYSLEVVVVSQRLVRLFAPQCLYGFR